MHNPLGVSDLLPDELSQAMVAWTGYGSTRWPQRDEARLVAALGEDTALCVLPLLVSLELDFYQSTAHKTARDLAEMTTLASADFRGRHPEVGEVVVQALAWCYSYDFK
jgi:hypothetical protein